MRVFELLQDRPAWYLLGPLIGMVVIGLVATINQRIGVLGGYSNVIERATGRTEGLGWKAWFLFGVLGAACCFVRSRDPGRCRTDTGGSRARSRTRWRPASSCSRAR